MGLRPLGNIYSDIFQAMIARLQGLELLWGEQFLRGLLFFYFHHLCLADTFRKTQALI